MKSKSEFCHQLAEMKLGPTDRAVALLWYYARSNGDIERTASELVNELRDEGFPKSNIARLQDDLRASKYTITGKRRGTFQVDVRRMKELDEKYGQLLDFKEVKVDDYVLPSSWKVGGKFFERMIDQINGTYHFGYYDACAVLCRRLMESLIIKVYLSKGRESEIKDADNNFRGLEFLITKVTTDFRDVLGRNILSAMNDVKRVGDTAAHDKIYLTIVDNINDIKTQYRELIYKLMTLSGIIS